MEYNSKREQRERESLSAEARLGVATAVQRYRKRAQLEQQSAQAHEYLRQDVEVFFGPIHARFFDVYGCLPYDRKSWFPGYPTNYLERRTTLMASVVGFCVAMILCFGLLPPEVLHVGERVFSALVPRILVTTLFASLVTAVGLALFRLVTPKSLAMREAYFEKYQELETLSREAKEAAARRARDERLGDDRE